MSHKATGWAFALRGIKPAAKMVLFYLADRHNPDFGCFPNQSTLAADAEMSVASINTHLRALEEMGLICRVQRVDRKTGKQLSTRYILGFEDGFTAKPSPIIGVGLDGTTQELVGDNDVDNSGADHDADSRIEPIPTPKNGENRLQKLESNLVKEPVKEPVKEEEVIDNGFEGFFAELIKTVGYHHYDDVPAWWRGDSARNHVKGWLTSLGLARARIIELAAQSRKTHPEPPDGPKGLDWVMERGAKERGTKRNTSSSSDPDEVRRYWAELINSDRYIVRESITKETRRALIAMGLVTEERMRERGQ